MKVLWRQLWCYKTSKIFQVTSLIQEHQYLLPPFSWACESWSYQDLPYLHRLSDSRYLNQKHTTEHLCLSSYQYVWSVNIPEVLNSSPQPYRERCVFLGFLQMETPIIPSCKDEGLKEMWNFNTRVILGIVPYGVYPDHPVIPNFKSSRISHLFLKLITLCVIVIWFN